MNVFIKDIPNDFTYVKMSHSRIIYIFIEAENMYISITKNNHDKSKY